MKLATPISRPRSRCLQASDDRCSLQNAGEFGNGEHDRVAAACRKISSTWDEEERYARHLEAQTRLEQLCELLFQHNPER